MKELHSVFFFSMNFDDSKNFHFKHQYVICNKNISRISFSQKQAIKSSAQCTENAGTYYEFKYDLYTSDKNWLQAKRVNIYIYIYTILFIMVYVSQNINTILIWSIKYNHK